MLRYRIAFNRSDIHGSNPGKTVLVVLEKEWVLEVVSGMLYLLVMLRGHRSMGQVRYILYKVCTW